MKVSLRNGFSDRNKIKEENKVMQIDSLDTRTRVMLSNAISKLTKDICAYVYSIHEQSEIAQLIIENLYAGDVNYFNNYDLENTILYLQKTIKEDTYDAVLTVVEYIIKLYTVLFNYHDRAKNVAEIFNTIFENEYVGYRFVGNYIVPITNEQETKTILKAAKTDFDEVNESINKAIKYLSISHGKDYKNSIKESITAVETLCKIFVGDDSATLGEALSKISSVKKVHPAFIASMNKLYGFTCDESGIRHGGYEYNDVGFEDAEYVLVTCSAFINYLISVSTKG